MSLANKNCIPCRGGVPGLKAAEISQLLGQVSGWQLNESGHLYKCFSFSDFAQAMALANKIAELAESVGHHPDLAVRWGELAVEIWTHKISALTESDFILAAKIDELA